MTEAQNILTYLVEDENDIKLSIGAAKNSGKENDSKLLCAGE